MAKSRKTINIEWLRNQVNQMLELSTCSDDVRFGFCAILENTLHKANRYRGYQNLDWINGGCEKWHLDGEPDFPEKYKYIGNDSRRYYI